MVDFEDMKWTTVSKSRQGDNGGEKLTPSGVGDRQLGPATESAV